MPEQVMDAPGLNVVFPPQIPPGVSNPGRLASIRTTPERVTLPVLVILVLKLSVSAASGGLLNVGGVALSPKSRDIAWLAVTVADSWFEATPLPEAVAVLVIEPALMSARVIVRVEVQVIDA